MISQTLLPVEARTQRAGIREIDRVRVTAHGTSDNTYRSPIAHYLTRSLMLLRSLLAGLALTTAVIESEAGPFRRQVQPTYQPSYQPVYQPTNQPVYQSPNFVPAAVMPAGMIVNSPTPAMTSPVEQVSGYMPAALPTIIPASFPGTGFAPAGGMDGDGLAEVNAKRAARGLRPFLRDEGLSQAARACAQFRAARGLAGHTSNDFAFVPAGTHASSAGCAAAQPGFGWMSCCVYENYTYAGAAWVTGRDGQRYMHLFVR
jgi:hypothetical protein